MGNPRGKRLKEILIAEFGTCEWTEAKEPFTVSTDWRSIARGKRLNGSRCAVREGAMCCNGVNAAVVTENFSYLRFDGSRTVYKYYNPTDLQEAIRSFDTEQDIEPDNYILEPPKGARSTEYQKRRREAIKSGVHFVASRGKNPNKKKPQKIHLRPY